MKNKIAIIIPTLHGAGCEKLLSEMLFYFEKEFNIDLILYENSIDYNIPKSINIKLLETDNSPNHSVLYKIYRLGKRINNIGKILKKNNYDVILSFIDGCNTNVYFGKVLHRVKTPLISAEHTINEGFFIHNPYSKKLAWLFKFLLKITYNGVDEVIVISNSMKKYIKDDIKVTNKNITTIYNGIDTNKFNLKINHTVEFEKDFNKAKIKILNVARLDDNKNQQYLINIMPDILKEKPNAKLFIIGKGEKEEELKNLIEKLKLNNYVYLLGWKTNVSDYMKKSNLFLMSSKYESFANVVVESLGCGTPVVTSKYDDVVYDIIENNSLGTVVEIENKKKYIKSILYYLDNEIDKNKLNDYVKNKFSIDNTIIKYMQVIKKAIE
jgi:glycosyltransferase involved in cell wall biosynthesis